MPDKEKFIAALRAEEGRRAPKDGVTSDWLQHRYGGDEAALIACDGHFVRLKWVEGHPRDFWLVTWPDRTTDRMYVKDGVARFE